VEREWYEAMKNSRGIERKKRRGKKRRNNRGIFT
jgi:hypothetical protein